MRPANLTDRTKIRLFAAVSLVALLAAAVVRISAPSPWAPRIHVRWSASLQDDQRAVLERRFSLLNGARRQDHTWEYDLVNLEPTSVTALIQNPAVEDTHYLDRGTGRVTADAPAGGVRLSDRRFAAVVHSFVFDWFLLFWVSSIVVSGVWLASDAASRD